MNLDLEKIEIFKQLLETPKKVVILSHTNPDGDAIGSSLAMAEVLKGLGHTESGLEECSLPYGQGP